jgi:tryptophan-rich sensory protein
MIAESLRGTVDRMANSRERTTRHLLTGVALTAGAVVISAVVARANAPTPGRPEIKRAYDHLRQPGLRPPPGAFQVIWPPLFLALTLSGLRIWNAPKSPARTQALTLWAMVQALNGLWMALGPRRLGGQLAAAVASLGTSAAYAWRARQVDAPAANLVAPYLGWISLANVLTEEVWRRNMPKPTLH